MEYNIGLKLAIGFAEAYLRAVLAVLLCICAAVMIVRSAVFEFARHKCVQNVLFAVEVVLKHRPPTLADWCDHVLSVVDLV